MTKRLHALAWGSVDACLQIVAAPGHSVPLQPSQHKECVDPRPRCNALLPDRLSSPLHMHQVAELEGANGQLKGEVESLSMELTTCQHNLQCLQQEHTEMQGAGIFEPDGSRAQSVLHCLLAAPRLSLRQSTISLPCHPAVPPGHRSAAVHQRPACQRER